MIEYRKVFARYIFLPVYYCYIFESTICDFLQWDPSYGKGVHGTTTILYANSKKAQISLNELNTKWKTFNDSPSELLQQIQVPNIPSTFEISIRPPTADGPLSFRYKKSERYQKYFDASNIIIPNRNLRVAYHADNKPENTPLSQCSFIKFHHIEAAVKILTEFKLFSRNDYVALIADGHTF